MRKKTNLDMKLAFQVFHVEDYKTFVENSTLRARERERESKIYA